MTSEEFETLLDLLGPEREEAARKYEEIRRKLIRFFQWRGLPQAEELADQVLDRVAHRVAGGTEIVAADKFSYFQRVAHFKFLEALRDIQKQQRIADQQRNIVPFPAESDRRLEALRSCLGRLLPAERKLVLGYFDGVVNSEHRKQLSADHALTLNALRIRVHRLCRKLEKCVSGSLEGEPLRKA